MDNDLKESNELVQRLALPESTKNFVFAIKVPEHDSTIYLLSVHNLSQRSATDAECLIHELRPDAVVTQVNPSAFGAAEDEIVLEDGSTGSIPTSVFEVVTRCVFDKKISKKKYKRVAGNLVMEEIFGTGFNKHLLTVEKVAGEVGSTYVVLDSPFVMKHLRKTLTGKAYHGSALINDHQLVMQRLLLSSHLSKGIKKPRRAPRFARSTYNLLVQIHNTLFDDLPAIRKALDSATKILHNVYKGESIDTEALTEAYIFRDAVESLRIASNNAGRILIKNLGTDEVQFSKLSFTDKSYALMADELRSQAKKFKTIVGVVDADNLAGLRRHWRTCVPQQVKDMSTEHTVQGFDSNDDSGALTLSKAIFASPMFKILTIKSPLNPFLTHKAMPFAFTKVAYPSTVMSLMTPCFASYGAQPMSLEKLSLSPRKIIRALTKFGLTSAQRTSFSTMRGAFYTMMIRKRLAKPIGALPRVVFGASLVIWWGSHVYGKGIEHAAVTLPSAPSIAKLGRGIQNLREASLEVTRRGNNRVQNTREGLSQRLSKNWTLNINFKTSFGS
ncbi:unnamed protein product [Eruca vesicaria subsp. sativa]|uniref:Uncharacterized protein n=1 Tax=Eruca vesicaria subsp. sativa TaxID=29727 RepID=A0ABC8KGN0_ERUVS|nr:unnamed protein product [Eruca vesicaria subsp. sativa]